MDSEHKGHDLRAGTYWRATAVRGRLATAAVRSDGGGQDNAQSVNQEKPALAGVALTDAGAGGAGENDFESGGAAGSARRAGRVCSSHAGRGIDSFSRMERGALSRAETGDAAPRTRECVRTRRTCAE
ncbi:hypothetical protein ERJ75_000600500 [Trypanosoma vivax]|nr:hypothetical protein ERJ75_000600500 [Trypanosoma vivax]